jgi:hypothetical protein
MNHRPWDSNAPEVPVDKNGNWISYPDYRSEWKSVIPWRDEFVIDHMETGRSSKIVVLRSTFTDQTYPMFIADLVKFIQDSDRIEDGVLSGIWTACKRGMNYGIKEIKL